MIDRICCDIDGVLADFIKASAKLFGHDPDIVTYWDFYPVIGHTEDSYWKVVNDAGSDFWANMESYPWTDELYETCVATAPTILLTTPSKCPSSLHGKLRWMQSKFGKNFRKYLVGPAKEFCDSPGSLLIDDSDSNVQKFETNGGDAILFPQPWNENRDISDPLDYVLTNLEYYNECEVL